ncbi:hypothetical protein ACVBE9_08940 [Eionea flava]
MNFLGICRDSGLIYQGTPSHATPLSPMPLLLPITFVHKSDDYDCMAGGSDEVLHYPNCVFKEDYFDPITQIRRGSIFKQFGNQPDKWRVQDSLRTDLKQVSWAGGVAQEVNVIAYQRDPLNNLRNSIIFPELLLGKTPFYSIWKILSIESSAFDVPVITLKSHRSFGVVPELLESNVPSEIVRSLSDALEKVVNSSHRLGPVDVVDRCRDALSIVFGCLVDNLTIDLGKAVQQYVNQQEKKNENLSSWSGRVVARLHSRGKPNEQKKQNKRALSEEDAQLALRCLWLVLVEQGWATAT